MGFSFFLVWAMMDQPSESKADHLTQQTNPNRPEPYIFNQVLYEPYDNEAQLEEIMNIMGRELSEPYSIYTYRYFINHCPNLCWLAKDPETKKTIGAIVCKLDKRRDSVSRGYIAMLAVDTTYRKKGIGSELVVRAIKEMENEGGEEVVLETEITNKGALVLYENLGFLRDKRLRRYYLNGQDAYRLKMILREPKLPNET